MINRQITDFGEWYKANIWCYAIKYWRMGDIDGGKEFKWHGSAAERVCPLCKRREGTSSVMRLGTIQRQRAQHMQQEASRESLMTYWRNWIKMKLKRLERKTLHCGELCSKWCSRVSVLFKGNDKPW